jgi:hypothetical protein
MSKAKSGITSLRTVGAFIAGRACSDTLFHVLNRAYDRPLIDEERAAMPLGGGILQHGYQCGMIWGSTLAAGAQAYRLHGAGPQAEAKAIRAAQGVLESFRALTNHTDCFEITGLNRSSTTKQMATYFLLKGGTIGCFRMAARYAPLAFDAINAALAEGPGEAPPAPVSCSAVLARKMGASDMHVVMAAGCAGGVGLSGGACGALAAALWITGMNSLKGGARKLAYKAPDSLDAIDRFLKCTDYEFECAKIAGRKFGSIGDHASYVCAGGCSKVIETLAAR